MSTPRYENVSVANHMLAQAEKDRDKWRAAAEQLASVLIARHDPEQFVAAAVHEFKPLHQRLRAALRVAWRVRARGLP